MINLSHLEIIRGARSHGDSVGHLWARCLYLKEVHQAFGFQSEVDFGRLHLLFPLHTLVAKLTVAHS